MPGPYSIGSSQVPGLSKLIEECGEVSQVSGKIIGLGHMGDHWDGSNLKERLEDELADLSAAIVYLGSMNGLDEGRMGDRAEVKLALFKKWHEEQSS